jgi:hypothetical protein
VTESHTHGSGILEHNEQLEMTGGRVTTIRSAEDTAALHDIWRELGPRDLNADPETLTVLLETREDVLRPHVVLAEVGGGRAMLVGRLERTRLAVRLGYRKLFAPSVRSLTVVQGGALGTDDAQALAAALGEAGKALRGGEADLLRLRGLRVHGPLHALATSGRWLTRGRTGAPTPRLRLRLPETLDDVLALQSTRSRTKNRRYLKKLAEAFGDRLSFHVYRDPADMAQAAETCAAVSAKTYQHALGAGFRATETERKLLELGARRGWARVYVLAVDGEAKAFWIGNVYEGVFFAGPTGYDPELARLQLGTCVLLHMLEDLCADPDAEELDWGSGDADYKHFFATHGWLEQDVVLFAPSFRGVRLNLTQKALTAAADAAKGVAGRVPALRGLKTRWRKQLRRSEAA